MKAGAIRNCIKPVLFAGFLILPTMSFCGEMAALSESDMADVSGQEGVAMNLEMAINANVSGASVTPIACPANTADCRLALQFNDRTDQWIVMKEYYGLIRLNKVWVDAANTPNAYTIYTNNGAALNPYLAGYDPRNKPVVQLSYDHSSLGAATSFYGDAALFLNVSRMTMEFGSTGYLNNAVTGSALALRIADGPNGVNGAAQIRFDGKMQMSGFGF